MAEPVLYKGERYLSKFEAEVAKQLDKEGVPFEHEPEALLYETTASYTPDFKIGSLYIETKGYFDPRDRRKMIAVKKSNPGLDIRIVFQNWNTKLSKATNAMTYRQWAVRHGFACADREVPKLWLKQAFGQTAST